MEEQLRKAFEEVTTNNIKTNIAYSKETRAIVRGLEDKVKHLEDLIFMQNTRMQEMTIQLAGVQAILYKGGS